MTDGAVGGQPKASGFHPPALRTFGDQIQLVPMSASKYLLATGDEILHWGAGLGRPPDTIVWWVATFSQYPCRALVIFLFRLLAVPIADRTDAVAVTAGHKHHAPHPNHPGMFVRHRA